MPGQVLNFIDQPFHGGRQNRGMHDGSHRAAGCANLRGRGKKISPKTEKASSLCCAFEDHLPGDRTACGDTNLCADAEPAKRSRIADSREASFLLVKGNQRSLRACLDAAVLRLSPSRDERTPWLLEVEGGRAAFKASDRATRCASGVQVALNARPPNSAGHSDGIGHCTVAQPDRSRAHARGATTAARALSPQLRRADKRSPRQSSTLPTVQLKARG